MEREALHNASLILNLYNKHDGETEGVYCCPLVGNIISCQRRQICCDPAASGMNLATTAGQFWQTDSGDSLGIFKKKSLLLIQDCSFIRESFGLPF